jgi:hypothetical protein
VVRYRFAQAAYLQARLKLVLGVRSLPDTDEELTHLVPDDSNHPKYVAEVSVCTLIV